MSYQALARKWRPRQFGEMVGQEHVLRALTNALEQQRLHHAYLFSGTRGVGKTTVARIFAKALNCEQGVGATPCGQCSACREIDEGRFVDLIEVDAASRTKVEDTRELMDNVQYAPTRGRFKIYLIDEVHMLSGHSFNALLKTLEEPPPHVKFLLATTEPQKLPVTILSRCLQFNLRAMPETMIADHLAAVLDREGIGYQPGALRLLAKAAEGSMRDALSLLDQAIAFGEGELAEGPVADMLGVVGSTQLLEMLDAVNRRDGEALFAGVDGLAARVPDFAGVLAELVSLIHRIAMAQVMPERAEVGDGEGERVAQLAAAIPPAEVQVLYQIALDGRRDLGHHPDPRSGFEMILLRMLAFVPGHAGEGGAARPPAPGPAAPAASTGTAPAAPSAEAPAPPRPRPPADASPGGATPAEPPSARSAAASSAGSDWHALSNRLGLRGMAQQLAAHCELKSRDDGRVVLTLASSHAALKTERNVEQLARALERELGGRVRLEIEVGEVNAETPAARAERTSEEARRAAVEAMQADPVVQGLQERFDAELVEESVRPVSGQDTD